MKVPTAGQAQTDPRQTRAYRWVLGVGVTAIAVLGLVLLLLLTQATNNQELYERNYARLFVLNVVDFVTCPSPQGRRAPTGRRWPGLPPACWPTPP